MQIPDVRNENMWYYCPSNFVPNPDLDMFALYHINMYNTNSIKVMLFKIRNKLENKNLYNLFKNSQIYCYFAICKIVCFNKFHVISLFNSISRLYETIMCKLQV